MSTSNLFPAKMTLKNDNVYIPTKFPLTTGRDKIQT